MAKPAGKRRWRVKLLRPVEGVDALNTPVDSWTAVATRSAARRDISSGERMRAQQLGATLDTRYTILADSEIAALDPTWRLEDVSRNRIYEITGVRGPDGVPMEFELDCIALATPDGAADAEA